MHAALVCAPVLAGVCLVLFLFLRPRRNKLGQTVEHSEPGTGWLEQFIGGSEASEERFILDAIERIHTVQRRNKESSGATAYARAFHAKILAGIENAEFRVLDDVPAALRAGYLQPGKTWKTTIRFSNASGKRQADTEKDLRGAALRVQADDGVYDLAMTSAAASHARSANQFIAFAMAASGGRLLMVPRLILSLGLREAIRMLRCVIRQSSEPVESLARLGYWSRSPYARDKVAFKFELVPTQSGESLVPKGDDFLSEDLVQRLKLGPVVFDFAIQLFRSERTTPIEDGAVEWNRTDSPLIVVAQLYIPQQDLTSAEAQAAKARVDLLEFNPWNTTDNFRPLGGLNRARKRVYAASVDFRNGKTTETKRGCPFHFKPKDRNMSTEQGPRNSDGAQPGRCPVRHANTPIPPTPPTPPSGNVGHPGPELHPENGLWRPKSKRVGVGPARYVWWNWFYAVMEFLNRKLSRDPYRKVSWDKWPTWAGLLYLIAKLRFNRSNALTDPYDYATNDNDHPVGCPAMPPTAKTEIAADGKWVSDDQNGQMGAAMTRMGSNIPPRKVRPDIENRTPAPRTVAKRLRWRLTDVDGNEIVIPALILNGTAAGWIQFQFHNFGGNTMRDPINQNPHRIPRDPAEGWPNNEALIDRTTQDPTRVTYDGRPTPINEKVHAWVQGQLYGNNLAEQHRLRSFVDGKLALGEDGLLLEDPSREGVDLTGFNNNWNPHLSFLHWLFTMEHNAICDYRKKFHPDWTDEQIFQAARKDNCAQIARIHTIEWTEDLLQHPTLQLGMHADYYGLLGQRLKCYLMRLSYRHRFVEWLLTPIRNNDIIWGMPGSKWEHHDGPFQVPKHFRLVYRLHEMILGRNDIYNPNSGELLGRVELIDFIHHNTRNQVKRFGYEALGWSFMSQSCGALKLHNFPRALTKFKRMQDDNLIDLAELDLFRELTDGTGSYNDFRVSVGEPPVTSFMELTGGDAALARELEICYEGDVNLVDAGIGILAGPKPDGFALSFDQFYQFVLNAPRRVKSNRFMSEGYNYHEYQEGMNWVEHGGGFKGVVRRHLPALREKLEGVKRGFAPWQDTETFPQRLLNESQGDIGRAFMADMRTLVLSAIAGGAAVWCGLTSPIMLASALGVLFVGSSAAAVQRMLARRFLQECQKKCYTDKRSFMFGTLYRSEAQMLLASLGGKLGSRAITIFGGVCAYAFWGTHPWVSLLCAIAGLSAFSTAKWSKAFTAHVTVLKIALRNRMRVGQPVTDAASVQTAAVDEQELERLFLMYAPGREYLTEYDFVRMHEGERVRARAEGRANCFSRLKQHRNTRKSARMLCTFADMIVEEDRNLVPAISKSMLRRVYQGVAQIDLRREKEAGDRDPNC